MNRAILGFFSFVIVATSAQAFTPFDAPMKPSGTRPAECTDFTGKYVGACTSEDIRTEGSFEITQDGCDVVSFGGHKIVMGGLTTMSCSTPTLKNAPAKAEATTITALWNEGKTAILLSGGKMVQVLGATERGEAEKIDGKVSLDGSKLLFALNLSGTGKSLVSCEYVKQ